MRGLCLYDSARCAADMTLTQLLTTAPHLPGNAGACEVLTQEQLYCGRAGAEWRHVGYATAMHLHAESVCASANCTVSRMSGAGKYMCLQMPGQQECQAGASGSTAATHMDLRVQDGAMVLQRGMSSSAWGCTCSRHS